MESIEQTPRLRDTLGRRRRYAGRQPSGKFVKHTPRDLVIFEKLQRHGILPSHYLFEFTKHLGRDRNDFQHRLKHLYNEDRTSHGGPYLDRPARQQFTPDAGWQHLSYILDKAGYRALEAAGKRNLYAKQADQGWYPHQQMTGAITASLELATIKHGLRYGDQEEIFRHRLCPESTRLSSMPLSLTIAEREVQTKTGVSRRGPETIISDQLFRITYPDNIKFFVLEADRASEDFETIRGKLRRWIEVLRLGIHRKHWGTPSLIVLMVTTSDYRMKRIMSMLDAMTTNTEPFLFTCKPVFGDAWHVPAVMYDLLETPWHCVRGTFDLMR